MFAEVALEIATFLVLAVVLPGAAALLWIWICNRWWR